MNYYIHQWYRCIMTFIKGYVPLSWVDFGWPLLIIANDNCLYGSRMMFLNNHVTLWHSSWLTYVKFLCFSMAMLHYGILQRLCPIEFVWLSMTMVWYGWPLHGLLWMTMLVMVEHDWFVHYHGYSIWTMIHNGYYNLTRCVSLISHNDK